MNLKLDTISYKNRFRNISASFKISAAFFVGLIAFISHVQVQLIVFFSTVIFLVLIAKIPFRFLCQWLLVPCLFLVVSLPALLINISPTALEFDEWFSIIKTNEWHVYISISSLESALEVITRSLSVFICVFALLVTTPFHQILHVFHKIGVPQVLLDIFVSMYRFIFIFLQSISEMHQVVLSRQGNLTWKRILHSAGLVLFQLFFKTFERYKKMSLVIESRGFSDRLFFPDRRVKLTPWKEMCYVFVFIILLIAFEWWCRNR
ncbi:cobalt ECF transporter T component CbiQ [Calidifontibacillus erzurumensis]|nr:cobalt ECF transporter T component CbiQ [Calidifontibacillus erzurumensis]